MRGPPFLLFGLSVCYYDRQKTNDVPYFRRRGVIK